MLRPRLNNYELLLTFSGFDHEAGGRVTASSGSPFFESPWRWQVNSEIHFGLSLLHEMELITQYATSEFVDEFRDVVAAPL